MDLAGLTFEQNRVQFQNPLVYFTLGHDLPHGDPTPIRAIEVETEL
jgi:hypothetical protein